MYYSYHAQIKKRIKDNQLYCYKIAENWNGISPALVLVFEDGRIFPVREERWSEYFDMIDRIKEGSEGGDSDRSDDSFQ